MSVRSERQLATLWEWRDRAEALRAAVRKLVVTGLSTEADVAYMQRLEVPEDVIEWVLSLGPPIACVDPDSPTAKE